MEKNEISKLSQRLNELNEYRLKLGDKLKFSGVGLDIETIPAPRNRIKIKGKNRIRTRIRKVGYASFRVNGDIPLAFASIKEKYCYDSIFRLFHLNQFSVQDNKLILDVYFGTITINLGNSGVIADDLNLSNGWEQTPGGLSMNIRQDYPPSFPEGEGVPPLEKKKYIFSGYSDGRCPDFDESKRENPGIYFYQHERMLVGLANVESSRAYNKLGENQPYVSWNLEIPIEQSFMYPKRGCNIKRAK